MSTLVTIIISAAIGLFTSYIFTKRSKLKYQISNLRIIGNIDLNLPDQFEVTVAGKRIDNLQKSQVFIWNGGNKTIDGDDIVKDDFLRLTFDTSTDILDVNIIGSSRKVSKFTAEKNEEKVNEVILGFDFLDKKDGAIVEILHTNSKSNVRLNGTIKGLKNGIKFKGNIDYYKVNNNNNGLWKKMWFSVILPLILSILLGTAIFFYMDLFYKLNEELPTWAVYVSSIIGIFFAFLTSFNVNRSRRKFPKELAQSDNESKKVK